jgi:dGTPase
MGSEGDTPRAMYEVRERDLLGGKATSSSDPQYTQREHTPYEPDDIRSEFRRDYTRIVHSRAFRRLRHKTQVFISPKNDHICSRMEHSLHVASVSQTIARALQLNEDLVEAIAVGHDLGHAPFGHIGERSLDRVAKKHHLDFSHERHSLRVVDLLESPYDKHPGLNLTFAVRDGIVCHFGEGRGEQV